MSGFAKVLRAVILLLGCAAAGWAAVHWQSQDSGLFFSYLIITTTAASLRLRLPGLSGWLSLHFFFVLLCLPLFDLPEILAIAAVGSLFQSLLYRRSNGVYSISLD